MRPDVHDDIAAVYSAPSHGFGYAAAVKHGGSESLAIRVTSSGSLHFWPYKFL